jgi:hypothetical protein
MGMWSIAARILNFELYHNDLGADLSNKSLPFKAFVPGLEIVRGIGKRQPGLPHLANLVQVCAAFNFFGVHQARKIAEDHGLVSNTLVRRFRHWSPASQILSRFYTSRDRSRSSPAKTIPIDGSCPLQ